MKKELSRIFDIVGQILAVVLVVVYALMIIDANYPFIANVPWLYNACKVLMNYGSIVLIAIVGLEAMIKRNIVFFIIFAAMLALIVIFLFFPGTYENLLGFIKK